MENQPQQSKLERVKEFLRHVVFLDSPQDFQSNHYHKEHFEEVVE